MKQNYSPSPSSNPGPRPKSSDAERIADLEAQLKRIKESGEVSPGNLQNQINGMSMLMLDVAGKLKMPDDWQLRDMPEWVDCIGLSFPVQQPPPPPAQA